MCVTSDTSCQFKEYEMKKLKWLKNQLSKADSIFHEEKETMNNHEVANGTELIGTYQQHPGSE